MTCITEASAKSNTRDRPRRQRQLADSDCSITTRSHPHTAPAETRHTTLTWVERNFGYAVAKAYAGHTDIGSDTGATATYVRATTHEVAAALAALTGEPHPLATQEGW
jgi:hypothetical protein